MGEDFFFWPKAASFFGIGVGALGSVRGFFFVRASHQKTSSSDVTIGPKKENFKSADHKEKKTGSRALC